MTQPPIDIWFRATAGSTAAAEEADVALLCDRERERYGRFRFGEDRRDYAAAHALLRTALSARDPRPPGGWRFDTRAGGKPYALATALTFSLSHCRGLVACAITTGEEVGIDVEPVGRRVDEQAIADRHFSRREAAQVAARTGAEATLRFVELWTLKEAHLKAIGLGLAHPLAAMTFDLDPQERIELTAQPDGDAWCFALFEPVPGFRLAVAAGQRPLVPRLVVRSAADGALRPLRVS